MNITGMLYGSRLLSHVDFPTSEVLGPGATEDQIQDLINRHKLVFIKPLFKGGVGKKGKSGLIGKASDLKTALAEKERLYFAEHRHGNVVAKAQLRAVFRQVLTKLPDLEVVGEPDLMHSEFFNGMKHLPVTSG